MEEEGDNYSKMKENLEIIKQRQIKHGNESQYGNRILVTLDQEEGKVQKWKHQD